MNKPPPSEANEDLEEPEVVVAKDAVSNNFRSTQLTLKNCCRKYNTRLVRLKCVVIILIVFISRRRC